MTRDWATDIPTGIEREIRIVAADILCVLWTSGMAENTTQVRSDLEVAERRGLDIMVLIVDDTPVPKDLFPARTRCTQLPRDPRLVAEAIKRIEREGGFSGLPLLSSYER
jgi:hypothetical protein